MASIFVRNRVDVLARSAADHFGRGDDREFIANLAKAILKLIEEAEDEAYKRAIEEIEQVTFTLIGEREFYVKQAREQAMTVVRNLIHEDTHVND